MIAANPLPSEPLGDFRPRAGQRCVATLPTSSLALACGGPLGWTELDLFGVDRPAYVRLDGLGLVPALDDRRLSAEGAVIRTPGGVRQAATAAGSASNGSATSSPGHNPVYAIELGATRVTRHTRDGPPSVVQRSHSRSAASAISKMAAAASG
jgi:hypothetical protein